MMGSTSLSPVLHVLPPPLQPSLPRRPAAVGPEDPAVGRCLRATGGVGGVVLEEAELSDRLTGRLIRQWRSEARGHREGRPVSFCCYFSSLTNLQVPVHYAIYVAMIYTFQNLLYAVTVEERETRPEAKRRGRGRQVNVRKQRVQVQEDTTSTYMK